MIQGAAQVHIHPAEGSELSNVKRLSKCPSPEPETRRKPRGNSDSVAPRGFDVREEQKERDLIRAIEDLGYTTQQVKMIVLVRSAALVDDLDSHLASLAWIAS